MRIAAIKVCFTAIVICTGSLNVQAQSAQPSTAPDNTLTISRQKIDSLDSQIIHLIGERERVVRAIGVYKAKHNIPSLQSNRFQQVVDKGVEAGKKEGLSPTLIKEVLNAIHEESLRLEDDIKAKKN